MKQKQRVGLALMIQAKFVMLLLVICWIAGAFKVVDFFIFSLMATLSMIGTILFVQKEPSNDC